MMNRRDFLLTSTSLGLTYLLSGCQQENATTIRLLQGSIPIQLISKFQNDLSEEQTIAFKLETQLSSLYQLLVTWHKDTIKPNILPPWLPFVPQPPPPTANLITIGNFWLKSSIEQNLIDPLFLDNLSEWQHLPSRWQELVTLNNNRWAAPYRWGSTVIAYRKDKFKNLDWTPKDWSDLWRPEVKRLISVIDQPREIIGLTLKKLGYSYNTEDLSKVSDLKQELKQLNQQIKFYSSKYYLQPFILGDTWLTVGWSNEILALAENNDDIAVVIPASGTALWTEMWVHPTTKDNRKIDQLSLDWMNFCWQPLAVNLISLFTNGTSPMIFSLTKDQINMDILEDLFVNFPLEILDNSEFIQPLPQTVTQTYLNFWKEMRLT